MGRVRFNHMELTVPRGTLDADMRADLTAFYGDVLGWQTMDVQIVGGNQFLMRPDDGQFILVAEHDRPLQAPGYDHLGLLCDSRADVDELLEQCQRWQEKDDRLRLKVYDDLDTPNLVVHAFYVKYLLPIWFDVQSMEHKDGSGPSHRWQYAPIPSS
jgi:hypothetical protein